MNGKKNTAFENLWDALKRVLRVRFRAANSLHLKRRFKISNPILHIKELEKEDLTRPKANRRKEIIKPG